MNFGKKWRVDKKNDNYPCEPMGNIHIEVQNYFIKLDKIGAP